MCLAKDPQNFDVILWKGAVVRDCFGALVQYFQQDSAPPLVVFYCKLPPIMLAVLKRKLSPTSLIAVW